MYGIFTYIYPINDPNVGKYTIHGSSGHFGALQMTPSKTPPVTRSCYPSGPVAGLCESLQLQKPLLLHNPDCSKSRALKNALDSSGADFAERRYLEDG